MTGHIVPGGEGRLLVRLVREQVLGLPLLRGEVPGSGFTARRVRRTARALRRRGVPRVLPQEDFHSGEEVEAEALRLEEPRGICRALAAPIALAGLEAEGVPPRLAVVALRGNRVTRSLREAALALCPVVRQLRVEVSAGGEGLRPPRRREVGRRVVERAGGGGRLSLWFSAPKEQPAGRTVDLSGDHPAPEGYCFRLAEKALPEDTAALPLLSALWSAGRMTTESMVVTAHFRT